MTKSSEPNTDPLEASILLALSKPHINERFDAVLAIIQKEKEEAEVLALKEPNDLLRSAYQIASRKGVDTYWPAFVTRLSEELEREHKIMYPPNTEQEQS